MTTEAFIWDATHGMRNLMDVLINDFGLGPELTGWTLTTAAGISADGLTIVGAGINPSGANEAWMAQLDPLPIPSTLFLFGSGLAGLGFVRRRKQAKLLASKKKLTQEN